MEDEEIILESKKSILVNEGEIWVKKGESNFDVAQGSFDGAECAELVGLYILADIGKLERRNPGIYRDDFLAVIPTTPRQGEVLKQKIIQIFKKTWAWYNCYSKC